jgi:hypothetical protein
MNDSELRSFGAGVGSSLESDAAASGGRSPELVPVGGVAAAVTGATVVGCSCDDGTTAGVQPLTAMTMPSTASFRLIVGAVTRRR